MGLAFVKSKPQARINSNNINMAESKTISPAQIPIRKKTIWFLIEIFVLTRLLPFNIFLELLIISINENTNAIKSNHWSLVESIKLVQKVPTITPKNNGMEINNVLDQMISFDRWKLYTDIDDPTKIGNLFVALAMDGGTPKKIITGNVIADPLLASVFISPLRSPQNKKRIVA